MCMLSGHPSFVLRSKSRGTLQMTAEVLLSLSNCPSLLPCCYSSIFIVTVYSPLSLFFYFCSLWVCSFTSFSVLLKKKKNKEGGEMKISESPFRSERKTLKYFVLMESNFFLFENVRNVLLQKKDFRIWILLGFFPPFSHWFRKKEKEIENWELSFNHEYSFFVIFQKWKQ